MSDYATKSDLKSAAGIDTSKYAKMSDLASLKSDVGELDIGKLKTVTDDLSKLTNTLKSDVVKKTIWWIGKKKVNAIRTIDSSNFVKKTDYDTKIVELEKRIPDHEKYITTNDFTANTFSGSIFDERLKQAKLVTNIDLNTVKRSIINNEEKIEKMQIFDLSCFLGQKFFVDDGFQNMFVYQPTFSTLDIKKQMMNIFLPGNQKEYIFLNSDHHTILHVS